MSKKRICPFCENELNTTAKGQHLYHCEMKKRSLTKKEVRFEYIKYNFPDISDKLLLEHEYVDNKLSLVKIRDKYDMDYKSILWLLSYHNIKARKHSESCLIGAERAKETFKANYGENITNPSQLESVKQKKRETSIKNYGVDNIRKWKPFYDYIKKVIESRYETDYKNFMSNNAKKVWENKTDDEKTEWLNKSILSDEAKKKTLSNRKGFVVSKIEDTVSQVLVEMNVLHTRQHIIKHEGVRKFYDFYLPDYDIIIEVNGDYWHASPTLYSENDIIKYPFGYKTAAQIWQRDLEKKYHADKKNIPILYIWEHELKENKKDLVNLIKNKLYEICKDKIY